MSDDVKQNEKPVSRPKRPRIKVEKRETLPSNFRGELFTNPKSRHELLGITQDSDAIFVSKISDVENSAYIMRHKARCRDFLYKIISDKDKKKLEQDSSNYTLIHSLLSKYNNEVKFKAVQAIGYDDCDKYCAGDISDFMLNRPDNVRLQTMERLKYYKDNHKIDDSVYQYIARKYFSDIVAKEAMANYAEIGMLRMQASGHTFNNNATFSGLYKQALRKTKRGSYKPEDYDLFGYNGRGEPLCPAWHVVESSKNFQATLPKVQKFLATMGVAPTDVYKFNDSDFADIINKAGGIAQVNDSPYKEFCKKVGLMLQMGSGKFNENKKYQLWEKNFASASEKLMSEDDKYEAYKDFARFTKQMSEKMKADFIEGDVSEEFFEAWGDNMAQNGEHRPQDVNWDKKKGAIPYKIEIHHNDRLVSGGKNSLRNFSLMVKFKSYAFDIHASKHQGESKNFVMKSVLERKNEHDDDNLIYQSSNLVSVRGDYFQECCDKCEVNKPRVNSNLLEKSAKLKQRTTVKNVNKSVSNNDYTQRAFDGYM